MMPAEPLYLKKLEDFLVLEEWIDETRVLTSQYLEKADELIIPAKTTMQVSMRDIQVHNDQLQETIVQTFSH